jgi:hypothetical protein
MVSGCKQFLVGTRFKIPCDAVEAGARTLEEWARVLPEERDIEFRYRASHRQSKHRKVMRTIQTPNERSHLI